ncbi:PSP1 family protein [Schizosaccharomyces cryophilus OY26]|uniref:PSP1 family protein n=1 Tax=Schizosaccharomyces cryophilus (strain OY26 / ATCC MYA-4695 / CBS 11777 / NBRC 106824 / NRRL Y48691) TaxID=653667 RepID=S9XJD2_SCHCR|nr:PSP1 family protein [Schizosaccharomyces cryophilus OY26]EPY53756.1 PSP1 family protein [Schizosaccharomyces cryophilus OY26]
MDTVFVPNPQFESLTPLNRQLNHSSSISIMEPWNSISSLASTSTPSSHPAPSDSQPLTSMDTSSPRYTTSSNQKSPSLPPGPSSRTPFTSALSNSYSAFPSQPFTNHNLLENPNSRIYESSPPSSSSSLSSPNQRGLYSHSSQLLSDELSFDPKVSIPPNELPSMLSSTLSKGTPPNFSPSHDRYSSHVPTSISKGQLANPSALANPLRNSPNNAEKWNRFSFSEAVSPNRSAQSQLFALQQQQQQSPSVQNSTSFPLQSVRPNSGDAYSSLSTGLSARRPSLNTDHHGRPIPATSLRLPSGPSLNGAQGSSNLQNVALNLSPRNVGAQAPLSADPTFTSFDFLNDNSIWSKSSVSPSTKYNLSNSASTPSHTSDTTVPMSSSRLSVQGNNVPNLVADRLDLANANGLAQRSTHSWTRHSASGSSRSSLFSPTTGRVPANLENHLAQLSLKQRSNSASFPSINTAKPSIVSEDLASNANALEELASPNELTEDRFAWPRAQRRSSVTDGKNYRLVPPPLRSSFDVCTTPVALRPTLLASSRLPSSAPPQTLHFPNVPPLSAPLSDVLESDVDASTVAQTNASASNLLLVEFKASRTDVFVADAGHLTDVKVNSYVIVEADRGQDLGRVVAKDLSLVEAAAQLASLKEEQLAALRPAEGNNTFGAKSDSSISTTTGLHPKHIYRLAEPREVDELASKYQDESQALLVCQAKVRQRKLPMEVLDGEYQWDRKKLTFYYHAKQRIDFRELVRDLFKVYKTRIWMCAVNESNLPANDSAGASW